MIAVRLLRDGAVVRETLFKDLPVTFGRGPECEFPLLDASVSRRHAVLEQSESGQLLLRDLESRNGVFAGAERVSAAPVGALLRCLVGGVEIEIQPLDDAITLELQIRDRGLERRRGAREYLRYMVVGVLGWLAAIAIEPAFWSPWEKERAVSVLGQAIAALIALPLGGVFLLILLKAFSRRLRLADTLSTLARLVWLSPLVSALDFLMYYALSSPALGVARAALGGVVLAWAVGSLAAIRRPGPQRLFRAVWAAAVLVAFWGIAATGGLRAQKAGQPNLDFHVQMPLAGYAGRAESIDQYMAHLSAETERAAKEAAATRAKRDD